MKALAVLSAIIIAAALFTSCAEKDTKHIDPPKITTSETTAATTATITEPTLEEEPTQEYISEKDAFYSAIYHVIVADDIDDFEYYFLAAMYRYNTELNIEGETAVYDVYIETPDYDYNYKIDAITGAVLHRTREINFDFDPEEFGISVQYTIKDDASRKDDALRAALDFFGFTGDDIIDTSVEFDIKKMLYCVYFTYDEVEYICEVSMRAEFMRSNIDVGPYGAQDIAFEHMLDNADNYMMHDELVNFALAGLMTNLKTDIFGGREDRTYRVSFCVGGFSYDYFIDGLSGEVIQYDRDTDPAWRGESAGAGYGNYISQYIATKTALDDAGIGPSGFRYRKVTLDTTDRQERYIVYFETEEYAYEYEIDAYSGDVFSSERSELIS